MMRIAQYNAVLLFLFCKLLLIDCRLQFTRCYYSQVRSFLRIASNAVNNKNFSVRVYVS